MLKNWDDDDDVTKTVQASKSDVSKNEGRNPKKRKTEDFFDFEQPKRELMKNVKNKAVKNIIYTKIKKEKKKIKKQQKRKRSKEEKAEPQTLETMRVLDPTVIDVNDEETMYAIEHDDNLSEHLKNAQETRLLITCSHRHPTKPIYKFCKELAFVFSGSKFVKRHGHSLKTIISEMPSAGFNTLLVVNERLNRPDTIFLGILPEGPTLKFRVIKHKSSKSMKISNDELTTGHAPEVSLQNFRTRLGALVARCLASSFSKPNPQYEGRRMVVFHNQRDFIFFRHYRYVFRGIDEDKVMQDGGPLLDKDGKRKIVPVCPGEKSKTVVIPEDNPRKAVALKELGPRISLRLLSVQCGCFDFKNGEYMWAYKRHEMDKARRKFHL